MSTQKSGGKSISNNQKHWVSELQRARTSKYKKWVKRGERADRRFRDEGKDSNDSVDPMPGEMIARLNLFNSNVTMLMSMLYGRIPKAEVSRRFADADDDAARVAALMLTRILNTDIEVAGEDMATVFRSALQDRLIPGLGTARVQYQFEEETETTEALLDEEGNELAPEVTEQKIAREWTDIIYTSWKDTLWSPARTYGEITWRGFRSYLTKKKFKKRFPKVSLDTISFSSSSTDDKYSEGDGEERASHKEQAEVWEIWDKDSRCVYWVHEGATDILDKQKDPLELKSFWPEPPPMVANVTTSNYLPKSDYDLAAGLYRAIDELETRIQVLTDACKLVGVYDKANDGIKRLLNEGVESQLIPVDNWAAFAEKGGLKGVVEWLPVKDVADVIQILTEKQAQKIQQLQQVTGMSDVMRGAAGARMQRVSATQDKLEAEFGSIRVEALQNDFARWVTDLQSMKVEIIQRHYQPEQIIKQSNIMAMPDEIQHVEKALALIKDPDKSQWRVMVRPETLAIADYAQLKQDRSDFLFGLAQFMQSAAPLLELSPNALPVLLKLLKWFLAGFRSSNEVEGILDQAIDSFEKNPPSNDKPDPQVEKMKMEMQLKQQESAQKMQQGQQEFQLRMTEMTQKFQLSVAEMRQEMQQDREKHQLEMRALFTKLGINIEEQKQQFLYNSAEREHEAQVQVRLSKQENGGGDK
jgi:hypothetical protein